MKKITLFLGMAIATTFGFSQIVVDITSAPSCTNLEGAYNFEMANNTGSVSGWGAGPDMFVGANAIVDGEMVLVDDGTTPGTTDANGNSPHPTIQDACDSTTWIQDLTGKVAVFYRGACEFGLKAFNAQKRGAIACFMINHTGDAVGMAGGTYGPNVTIPMVMVSEDDGNAIAACLGGGGTMQVFIGSKVGLYPNDMGTDKANVMMARSTGNPLSISQDSSEFNINLGMYAYNVGQNTQNGVTINATIEYMGSVIHSVTSAPLTFPAPDTSFVDTQFVDLGNYGRNPAWLTGEYTLTYTINTSVSDDAPADNVHVSKFRITADNIYAKSQLVGANEPFSSTAYSLNETTTQYDNWEACITFQNSNASRLKAMGMTYSCTPVGQTMAGELIEGRLYEWNDAFTDLNDAAYTAIDGGIWTLNQVGGFTDFYLDETEDGVLKYAQFDEAPITLVDNQRYLFCMYNESDSLRISYDTQKDYSSTIFDGAPVEWTVALKVAPNAQPVEWYGNNGFGYDAVPSITANFDLTPTSVEETANNTVSTPYPNPAANLLSIPVKNTEVGNVVVEVFDVTGKLVHTENSVIGNGVLTVNVAAIANGSYVFKTTFANGASKSHKVSVNR